MSVKDGKKQTAKAKLNADDMESLYSHDHGFNHWAVKADGDGMLFLYCRICKENLVVLVDCDDIAELNGWMDAKTSEFQRDRAKEAVR